MKNFKIEKRKIIHTPWLKFWSIHLYYIHYNISIAIFQNKVFDWKSATSYKYYGTECDKCINIEKILPSPSIKEKYNVNYPITNHFSHDIYDEATTVVRLIN